jgi:Vanadium chloroperoxidase N-terminal domain/PAP2 superfamily
MDQILYWNDVALEANRISFTDKEKSEQGGPTLSSRALGIIHLAMHDAYVGTSGTATFTSYLGALPAAPVGSSIAAAIAGAAHTALISLYPKQKSFFDKKLNSLTHILSGEDKGHRYGCKIALLILAERNNDPNNSDAGYFPHTGRGLHKPDPDNVQGFLAPNYGAKSKPFAVTARHDLVAPPFNNPDYLRAVKQVRGLGIAPELMGTVPNSYTKRNVDQTLIGIFWGYDGANSIGTPPRLYNQIVREVAMEKNNTLEQNVRLFALVNAAMADAGILAWDQKYIHNFWRPVVGIREHDKSMGSTGVATNNISNDCDTQWLPLGAPKSNVDGSKNFTPDFPAYPSGHATFGSAALHITRLFYGVLPGNRKKDDLFKNCDFVSDEFNGVTKDHAGTIRPCHTRNFPNGLWQMILENGLSRVYLGVHWSFDAFKTKVTGEPVFDVKVGGVDLGLKIAEDIFASGLQKSSVPPRS